MLNDGLGNVKDLDNILCLLIVGNLLFKVFVSVVIQIQEVDFVWVMYVDLDYVYDFNFVQQVKNIDKLVQCVYDMKISYVFLQVFFDLQGDGMVKLFYFFNCWLLMCVDLFNFVFWQLQICGNVKVYVWMLVLVFDFVLDLLCVQCWDL